MKKRIYFVTSNKDKLKEARAILPDFDVEQIHMPGLQEIQEDSLEKIAEDSVRIAYKTVKKSCFVEDAGVFLDALRGFPGPYSKYVWHTIGLKGMFKLMDGVENRDVLFRAAVAYTEDGKNVKVFVGESKGTMPLEPRGSGGFGYDPMFVPEGRTKTNAEDIEYKHKVSHRGRALRKLGEYLKGRK